MKRAAALMMALPLVACMKQDDGAGEIRQAIPTARAVQVKVPGAGSAKPGAADRAGDKDVVDTAEAVGDLATFYQFTRGVSQDLNGGAGFVLVLVHTIVQYPVTSVEGDTFIWGPWTETLNPSQYRLTVREDDDGSYVWSLEGRRKSDGEAAPYLAVVSGDALPGDEKDRGSGTFMMDFEIAERLDPAGNDGVGLLAVTYDLSTDPAEVVMDYETMAPTPEGGEELATFHYEYRESPADGSGDFQFAIRADLDDNGSAWETADVRSRWLSTGAGRSDVSLTGGDAGTTIVQVSECWDKDFGRVYYTDTIQWQPTEGDATSCEIADALFPTY